MAERAWVCLVPDSFRIKYAQILQLLMVHITLQIKAVMGLLEEWGWAAVTVEDMVLLMAWVDMVS